MTRRRPSFAALSAVVRLSLGVALVVHEGMIREQAQLDVLFLGASLLALPEAVKFDRWLTRLRALAVADEEETAGR